VTEQINTNSDQAGNMSIGQTLRAAREKHSFSISYVASHTHLKEDIIVAIENDDHEQLSGPVFVKGYIRSYAKLLDLDVEPLIGDYSQANPVEYVTPEVKRLKKVRSSGADPVVIWSSVTVVALLVGLMTTWWLHRDASDPVELASVVDQFDESEVVVKKSAVIEELDTDDEQSKLIGLGNVNPKNISQSQNALPVIAERIIEETKETVQQEVETTTNIIESPSSGGDVDKVRITVRYTQESWTEIFDARKRRLLHGLIKPGATRVISGQAPFNVFLGNSPGVELEINGKPFDHSVYMRRNNTARFLIDDVNS